jgi:hypothetical protein
VRVPLEVRAEGVDDGDYTYAYAHGARGTGEQGEPDCAVEEQDRPELPGCREHEVVVGHLQQIVQHLVGPAVGRVLAAGRAEARLAECGTTSMRSQVGHW